jgi:hypothetical protein
VDLDEILYDIEDDLDSKLIYPVPWRISKWRTSNFLRRAQFLNRLVDLYKILYGCDGIVYYHDYILYNPVLSNITKWRTFTLSTCVKLLNRLVDLDEMFYGDDYIEGNLDSIQLSFVASTISKWRTFKLLRWCKYWTAWWIWMKLWIWVMTLNIAYCKLM